MAANARITVPATISRGETFEVRIQIRHPMETGYRADDSGRAIARNVIRELTCRYAGEPVFSARMSSGIAANPYLRFFVTARSSGELAFDWIDDAGERGTERVSLNIV
jgi:sulfur-oxidizing protein SoxZ